MSDSGRNSNVQENSKAEKSSGSGLASESPAARAELRAAEAKVAWGIKYLYAIGQPYARYDQQGVATVTLEPERFNEEIDTPDGRCRIGDLFPNGLSNGVTIQFFDRGYIRHPAAFYMLQQKINSLCNAAKYPPANLGNAADIVAQQLTGTVRAELDKKILEIKNDNKKYPNATDKSAAVSKIVDEIMQNVSYSAVRMLHETYLQTAPASPLDFANFSQHLLDTSAHHRTDKHDILTFNTETHHFSYDEATKVTAHDRGLGNGCSNLSIAMEGNYGDSSSGLIATRVNNTLVRHASPVALDDIASPDASALINDTARNMLEVAATMARLRLHGRKPEDHDKPMKIDWVYQILTTNVGNSEHQAEAYGYITRAARLLNHSNMMLGDTPVSLDVSVLNAGINKMGGVGSAPKLFKIFTKVVQKSDTQRRENRHAYRQLTNAVNTINVDPRQLIHDAGMQEMLAGSVARLKNMLLAVPQGSEVEALKTFHEIAEINKRIAINSQRYVDLNNKYLQLQERRKNLVITINDLRERIHLEQSEGKNSATKNAMMVELDKDIRGIDAALLSIPAELAVCDAVATANYEEMVVMSNLADKHQREKWKQSHPYVRGEVMKLHEFLNKNNDEIQARLSDPRTAEATTDQVQSICALIYKSYADELYFGNGEKKYAEVYRTPEKAALFNAYLLLFQYLTPGMMGSTGCKSANDRTMVMRLLVAGLANLPAPPALHDNPLADSPFIKSLNDMVMTMSAVIATIADTQGATPKVDDGGFSYLKGIENLKTVSHFGRYAPHKMKISQPKAVTQTSSATSQSTSHLSAKAALYQPRRNSLSSADSEESEEHKETSKSKVRPRSPSNSQGGQ